MKNIYLITFQQYAVGKEFKPVNDPRYEIVVGSYEDLINHCNDNISSSYCSDDIIKSDWNKYFNSLKDVGDSVIGWLSYYNGPTEESPESYDGYISIDTEITIEIVNLDTLKELKKSHLEMIAKKQNMVDIIDGILG